MKTPTDFRFGVSLYYQILWLLLAFVGEAFGATHYVWTGSPSPGPPFASWATAAHDIQQAVDAAEPGDLVLVTNGLYATGGRPPGSDTTGTRVFVDKALTVQSVNGPDVTRVEGYQLPGVTNGLGAIRCVYLAEGAVLDGFTVANGATGTSGNGGGVNGKTNAVVTNCVISGNSAYAGGGISGAIIRNCTLTGNTAVWGGGAFESTIENCRLLDNMATYGGGVYQGIVKKSLAASNSAYTGGGASFSKLNHCTLVGNNAWYAGGGAYSSSLSNCIAYYNQVAVMGRNYSGSSLNHCCSAPMPDTGIGNLTAEPQLVDLWHLSATSPCRGGATASALSGTDLDGEVWGNPPSIGCDEYQPGDGGGPLVVQVVASFTNVAVGFPVVISARVDGRGTANVWESDGTAWATNCSYVSNTWLTPGDRVVSFRVFNSRYPAGVSASVRIHVVEQPVHYVDLNSANPTAPYSSWLTSATNIQDAVDAACVPGALVLVSNGVYNTGARSVHGTMLNRVAVTRPVHVRSVNGPDFTTIEGYQVPGSINGTGAVRCVYLTNGASLSGFTLTRGATQLSGENLREQSGGGIWTESSTTVVTNCVLTENSAGVWGGGAFVATLSRCRIINNTAKAGGGVSAAALDHCIVADNSSTHIGGGAYSCTLTDCAVTNNVCSNSGGGVNDSTLMNCVLAGNAAEEGGGASGGTLTACILTGNSAQKDGGGAYGGRLFDCTLRGNSTVASGGGASGGRLSSCVLEFNSAAYGGGAAGSWMTNCTIRSNVANRGGGVGGGNAHHCTLSGNTATHAGGGVSGGTLYHCVLKENTANVGGGAEGGELHNCLLTGNLASGYGGGACAGSGIWDWIPVVVNNCTVIDNTAADGGGVFYGNIVNSIVYFNEATTNANYSSGSLDYCCTTPVPESGLGNFSSPPLFIDYTRGDLRPQPCSPVINAGRDAATFVTTDLDGNTRIVSGAVDLGAYEYQGSGSIISYAWLQQYGFATDGSADNLDVDGDGHCNWQEWHCQTDPTNNLSCLVAELTVWPGEECYLLVQLTWSSVPGVNYFIERSADPASGFVRLVEGIPGEKGTTSYFAEGSSENAGYYRVGIDEGNWETPVFPRKTSVKEGN